MANHHLTGKNGEELARLYLERNDFIILHTNWRYSYYEIDIVAHKAGVLHFIEVKTRRSLHYGFPEESVSDQKMERLMTGAEAFLNQHPEWNRIQYDVLAINIWKNNNPEFFFIEDVYL